MPDGKYTKDAVKMSRAWKKIYRPIEKEFGLKIIGYDPGILFKDNNWSFQVSTAFAIQLCNLIKLANLARKNNA